MKRVVGSRESEASGAEGASGAEEASGVTPNYQFTTPQLLLMSRAVAVVVV
jgi:hypothetical protein